MVIHSLEELQVWLAGTSSLYLYGAGIMCELLIKAMQFDNEDRKIESIWVTKKRNADRVKNEKVQEYVREKLEQNIPIILAVTSRHHDSILNQFKRDHVGNELLLLSDEMESILKCYIKKKNEENIGKTLRSGRKPEYDIWFFSPPYWDVYSPFSAVPCLKASLEKEGYKVGQIDLGILTIHKVIQSKWKQAAEYVLSETFFREKVMLYEKNTYQKYEDYVHAMWFLEGDKFDYFSVKTDYFGLDEVQRGVLDVFYSYIYGMNLVDIDFDHCSSIDKVLNNTNFDMFYDVFKTEEVDNVLRAIPGIVGISITSTCQFVYGCYLAMLIKKYRPDVQIIFGGSCADLFINSKYTHKQDILQYFDYLVIGEGETALSMLLRHISQCEGKIEEIPNLVLISESGEMTFTHQIMEDVDSLPAPDYDGLPLQLYLAPLLVLPYQTSRGCHYGMCAFCNHDPKYRHNYRSKNMQKVVSELVELSSKYHTGCFQFVDEAIRPDCFEKMVEEMDAYPQMKAMKWIYYSRVSRKYTKEVLMKARRNGCEMVMFGVETLNQRLLNFIKKGITAETSKYCLKLFHDCGIKIYAWLMCNLPSETLEEVRKDYEEVKEQLPYMDAFSVGPFGLYNNTDMSREPEKYNILEIKDDDPLRFVSHNNGTVIDKEAMLDFYANEYAKLQLQFCFTGNRYTVFFNGDKIYGKNRYSDFKL